MNEEERDFLNNVTDCFLDNEEGLAELINVDVGLVAERCFESVEELLDVADLDASDMVEYMADIILLHRAEVEEAMR